MKVFLSHSSRDKALVREVRSHLPDDVKTWLDEDELLVGQDLKISIKSAIQEDADFVVIFLGKEAVASEWVKRELESALERERNIGRVFVLPVLLDDVWDTVEPAEFRNRFYIKCFDQSEDAVRGVARKLSDHIFSWLSRHLDESKRKDLEKKRDAEATGEALKAFTEMTNLAERKDFVRRSLRLASRLAATLGAFRRFPAQRELFWREWAPAFQELVTLPAEKPPFEREGFDVAFDKMVKVIVRCQVDLARLELTVYQRGQPGQPTLDEATVTALVTPVDESSTEALEVLQCYLNVAQDELNRMSNPPLQPTGSAGS